MEYGDSTVRSTLLPSPRCTVQLSFSYCGLSSQDRPLDIPSSPGKVSEADGFALGTKAWAIYFRLTSSHGKSAKREVKVAGKNNPVSLCVPLEVYRALCQSQPWSRRGKNNTRPMQFKNRVKTHRAGLHNGQPIPAPVSMLCSLGSRRNLSS